MQASKKIPILIMSYQSKTHTTFEAILFISDRILFKYSVLDGCQSIPA